MSYHATAAWASGNRAARSEAKVDELLEALAEAEHEARAWRSLCVELVKGGSRRPLGAEADRS